ncbi:MAG: bifunctional DNA-formamidopyrimidine glycosylase/DNA-(apurinic or apyrimidinic site) lyase [Spongiibacteraceae bacterium]
MPELPEVETVKRGIAPHLLQQDIVSVLVRERRLRWPIDAELEGRLVGRRVLAVERRAKYLLIELSDGVLMVHLGMSGRLYFVAADTPVGKHDHVDIVLSGGRVLRYTDPRRFGAVLWCEKTALTDHKLLQHLGPEPLTDDFDADYLYGRSRHRNVPVKTFLMDGQVVVGVGNIYANEALFMAGIRPSRKAGNISLQRYQKLVAAVKKVLAQAIAQGGTTLKDFVGGDGKPGYFKQELNVYGRAGLPCSGCGRELLELRLAQRSTVYCKHCQR